MPSIQLPDGRHEHVFSASWLSNFAQCPEQARQRYYKLSPFTPNDYNALGSALHHGIEVAIDGKLNGPEEAFADVVDAAETRLGEIEDEAGFTYKKWTYDSVRVQLTQHLTTFWDEIYPIVQPIAVEKEFNLPLYDDAMRSIRLRGYIDYIDADLGVVDWKTSGQHYKVWEKERYEKQPTVYAWAEDVEEMRYVVFVHGKSPQTFVVKRNPGHIEWLKRQALAAARLIEANLSIWPMVDSGWHCSPRWCAAWDSCRGQFLGSNPW